MSVPSADDVAVAEKVPVFVQVGNFVAKHRYVTIAVVAVLLILVIAMVWKRWNPFTFWRNKNDKKQDSGGDKSKADNDEIDGLIDTINANQ